MDVLIAAFVSGIFLLFGYLTWTNPFRTCPATGWWMDTGNSDHVVWQERGDTMTSTDFNDGHWPEFGSSWVYVGRDAAQRP